VSTPTSEYPQLTPLRTPPLPPAAKRRRKRWPWVVGVGALLVVIIAAASGGSNTSTPTTPTTAPATTTQPSLAAWWTGGGKDRADAISADLTAMGQAGAAADVSQMNTACRSLQTDTEAAQAHAPVPDAAAQQDWADALAQAAREQASMRMHIAGRPRTRTSMRGDHRRHACPSPWSSWCSTAPTCPPATLGQVVLCRASCYEDEGIDEDRICELVLLLWLLSNWWGYRHNARKQLGTCDEMVIPNASAKNY